MEALNYIECGKFAPSPAGYARQNLTFTTGGVDGVIKIAVEPCEI